MFLYLISNTKILELSFIADLQRQIPAACIWYGNGPRHCLYLMQQSLCRLTVACIWSSNLPILGLPCFGAIGCSTQSSRRIWDRYPQEIYVSLELLLAILCWLRLCGCTFSSSFWFRWSWFLLLFSHRYIAFFAFLGDLLQGNHWKTWNLLHLYSIVRCTVTATSDAPKFKFTGIDCILIQQLERLKLPSSSSSPRGSSPTVACIWYSNVRLGSSQVQVHRPGPSHRQPLLVFDTVSPYPGLLVVFRLYSALLPPSVACIWYSNFHHDHIVLVRSRFGIFACRVVISVLPASAFFPP